MQSQNVNPPGRSFLFFPFHQTSDISCQHQRPKSGWRGFSSFAYTEDCDTLPPYPRGSPRGPMRPSCSPCTCAGAKKKPCRSEAAKKPCRSGRAGAGAHKDKRRRGGGEGLFEILGIHPSAGTDTTRREVIWSRWNGWVRRRPAPPLTTGAGPTIATAAFSQRTTRPCARRAKVVRIMMHHLCGLGLINVRFWVVDE